MDDEGERAVRGGAKIVLFLDRFEGFHETMSLYNCGPILAPAK
jgi:hypothetical protein